METQADFFNRELSWLEFNERVLEEAEDVTIPPLERLKFLAITSSNLDEFFMVRVGGLQILVEEGLDTPDVTGMTPDQQLEAIRRRVRKMLRAQYECYSESIGPQLREAGIRNFAQEELTEELRLYLKRLFEEEISAVVTPMAVTEPEKFPLLANLALNIAVRLEAKEEDQRSSRYMVIPLGPKMPRFLRLPASTGFSYLLLEDVVKMFIESLCPGESILETVVFRITRNADITLQEDSSADLLAGMEEVLIERKMGNCVRLEIEKSASAALISFFKRSLQVDDSNIYRIPGPLNLSAFMQIATMDGYDHLQDQPWPPQLLPEFDLTDSVFTQMAKRDFLLFHPYESYEPVLKLIETAAEDPQVLAIKQILYRTSQNSPVVAALKKAAERGKYVTVLVELKARFDEARNIEWAKELERAGAQVIYGVRGLKTHAKLCIVVRREEQGVVRYLHFGTGNYNERTAKLYSDISYMTSDEDLGRDASAFFNAIAGYTQPQEFLKIIAAPLGLRDSIMKLIADEIQRRYQGQDAMIMAKMNSLVDPAIIRSLYEASAAGVKIMLNVRGICCLRPGVPGLSENITVVSIVDRFLEHSRIFYFYHGGEERLFISSADWMPRNLDRRIELFVPVDDKESRQKLLDILKVYFRDNVKSRRLLPDGRYRRTVVSADKALRCQEYFYRQACESLEEMRQAQRTVFVPHRPPDAEE